MGIPAHATVADALLRTHRRNHRAEHLRRIENLVHAHRGRDPTLADLSLWKHSADAYQTTFNSKKTWLQFREAGPEAEWHKGVWFTHSTPKFSFCAWLATHNRLSTGDRMLSWNMGVNTSCVLCHHPLETRSHLFFDCVYSATIWKALMQGLLRRKYSTNWQAIVSLISDSSQPLLFLFLARYAFQATIHSIWKERNSRRHGEQPLSPNLLITLIDKLVRNRASSIRMLGDTKYEEVLHTWLEARQNV
uniref:Reverse transcriptase zinc-binding domain-containing protein n=1 Tax=Noccaea caerulescens TaxID=107243 RepID=A0A1J3GTC8_NOCCA